LRGLPGRRYFPTSKQIETAIIEKGWSLQQIIDLNIKPNYLSSGTIDLLVEMGQLDWMKWLAKSNRYPSLIGVNRLQRWVYLDSEVPFNLLHYRLKKVSRNFTKEQMNATLHLNKKIKPEFGTCFFFHPYKATHLYTVCEDHGLLKDEQQMLNMTSNYDGPFIKLTHATEKECRHFQKKITFFFFRQTFAYRVRKFLESQRGIKKVMVIAIIVRLMFKATKIYLNDYMFKCANGHNIFK
jgi:hypothetical protein